MATQYGFFFDNCRCSGCKTCQIACKDYNDLGLDHSLRRVYNYEGGSWEQDSDGCWIPNVYSYYVSVSCNHCTAPICVYVCPTGAMHKEENGLVRVNSDICIGCGYCTMSCPYHAPHVSETTHASTKCHGCYDRVVAGKQPICVEACPLRALDFGEMTAIRMKYQGVAAIAPLCDPSATMPNLVIKPLPIAREYDDFSGFIANPEEVV